MKLREYRKEDAAAISSWVTDEITMYEWSADRIARYPFDAGDLDSHHEQTMRNERFMPYTFVDDTDMPVGHIVIRYPDPDDDRMVRFGFVIIDPKLRGRGLGKKMLDEACDYSKDVLHADRVTLSVFSRNSKALKCYTSAGFRRTGEETYTMPTGVWKALILEKVIGRHQGNR